MSHISIVILGLLWLNVFDANIGYFWQITDLHYDPFHSSQELHKGYRHSRGNNEHHHRNSRHRDIICSWCLIQSAAALMAKFEPDNLQFVFLTGNILSASMEHLSEDIKLEAITNVTNLLKRTFKSHFVFPALGHNDPPLFKKLAEIWKQWLPNEALKSFETGGYYTIEQTRSKLRIIVLNSMLWTNGATINHGPHKINMQWEWLETVLFKARRRNEKVYLVAHEGPGVQERSSVVDGNELTATANAKFLLIIKAFNDIIAGQFFGHRHADTFRIIYSKGQPVSWALMAPSLTPRSTSSSANPGLRLYKFESNNGKILDYTQYYLDMKNMKGETDWAIEYNLTQYYGLREVTALTLHALAEKILYHKDRGVLEKYINALYVRHGSHTSKCDSSCVHFHYCAITRVDYYEFRTCMRNLASGSDSCFLCNSYVLPYAILILISS